MIKSIALITGLLILFFDGRCQNTHSDTILIPGSLIIGADTLPHVNIKEVRVYPKTNFTSRRKYRQYTKLMKNVKKAYPFAVIARNELKLMNDSLQSISSEKGRKKYIKEYEREMFRKYEADLRKLTYSQGKILIKLVYREIGNTSYELVKEYRGDFSAVFWQGVARLFGSNLKSTYDPYGEDAEIENIVLMIEDGVI